MDHFGIGAAVLASIRIYMQSARRTGRTTSLVESVKDGDRICFACSEEARRVEQLLRERGVQVACIVVDLESPWEIFGSGTSQGRTLFDHGWVEQYYLSAIEHASSSIDHFQREASGYGEAHRETRRRAEEVARWGQ
ncbi:hypothetical protein N5D77_22055 [Comamonas thiooxydans]|uniref:Uncharacterized protein n=1 Tax=Comamonas thiooxydans TaxID=363952 RepID=A0AA42Q3X7_9BURK|nr:hypothetical protein [Comamonas thiooxydans]MDH1336802.1 hypothetical protein [Comamonas thiooxydans]MDH1742934.1 hypothetical protein [Comamonas thiooxydans]MDH1789266.1 hypothetical protein [Comamonas thiooxydans]